jgi:hypothetical protein
LLSGEIAAALEHAPADLGQDGLVAILDERARLGGAHVVQRVVHLGNDVEAIENVQGFGASDDIGVVPCPGMKRCLA